MKTLDFIQLDAKKVQKTIKELAQLLADLQIYYTNLRGLHWNIQGGQFFELHEKFEELYTAVEGQIDEVAERILILGGVPENKFSAYLKTAVVKEAGVINNSVEALTKVLEDLKIIIAQERKVSDVADDADDEVTEDLVTDYIAGQEKQIWMFVAYLKLPASAGNVKAKKSVSSKTKAKAKTKK